MVTWPDDKRTTVTMAFDLDAETTWITRGDGNHGHITNLFRGAHGPRQGVPKTLDTLDVHGVKATFFTPGVTAEHYPLVVKEISRRSHEIGFHGYLYEEPIVTSYGEEDVTMIRCETTTKDLTGRSIAGHRGPGGVIHDYSLRLLLEHDYLYSSNWRDSDGPFVYTMGGRQVPLVELPKDSISDDTAYGFYTDSAPERYKLKSPREMLETWKDGSGSLAAEGRMIDFVLYSQFIGHASRVNMLSELIGYMLSHGAWTDTNWAVTEYVLENRDLLKPDR